MIASAETEDQSDEMLLIALSRGIRAAGDTLCSRYNRALIGYLIKNFKLRHADAEDIAQQTWLRVLKAARRFDPSRVFSVWLFTIAQRLVFDHTAKAKRCREMPDSLEPCEHQAQRRS